VTLFAGKDSGVTGIFPSVPRFTGRRLARLRTVAMVLVAASAAGSATASGDNFYNVRICPQIVPDSFSPANLTLSVVCNSDGALTSTEGYLGIGSQNGDPRTIVGDTGWRLQAPAGITFAVLQYARSFSGQWVGPGMRWELRSNAVLGGAGTVFASFNARNPDQGLDPLPSPTAVLTVMPPGASTVWSVVGCAIDSCQSPFIADSAITLNSLTATLDDPSAPTVSVDSAIGAVSGSLTQRVVVGDGGSGVKSARFSIDGALVSTQTDTSTTCTATVFTVFHPCALGALNFQIDTTTLPEGPHTVSVTATDAAGNSSTGSGAFTVSNTPLNSAPPAFTGPAAIGAPLIATTGTWGTSANGFNFRWLRCPATVTSPAGAATCTPILGALDSPVYTPTGDDAGKRLMVQVTAVNSLAPQTRAVTVFSAPSNVITLPTTGGPPPGGGPPPPGATDRTPPALSAISLSRTRFRAPAKGTATLLRLTSSEAAKLSVVIQRALPGKQAKRAGKTVCVAVRTAVKRGRCTIYKTATTLTQSIAAGHASVALSGRAGTRKLAPGTYRITLVARDAAGNTSAAKRLTFTVLR
jgi:hypothetical protein